MNSIDFTAMLGNISQSLLPVQKLISGFAYLIGTLFIMTAITKLKKMGGQSHEKISIPIAYMMGGAALIFLPTTLNVLSNTAFGSSNVLAYSQYNPYSVYSAMGLLIQTAGLVWFVRGCILLVHSSEPGVKHGSKGMVFLIAGVLAMHFDNTIAVVNYMVDHLVNLSLTIKTKAGY